MRKTYGQTCGLAWSLDLLGERWTLLLVRELLVAPRRFSELAASMPQLGSNGLTDRLNLLRSAGVVEALVVEHDRRGRSWQLTAAGQQLRAPVLALASWGLRFAPRTAGLVEPSWSILALEAMADTQRLDRDRARWRFVIDAVSFSVTVRPGSLCVQHEQPCEDAQSEGTHPEVTVQCGAELFVAIGSREVSVAEALRSGSMTVSGRPDRVAECLAVLGLDSVPDGVSTAGSGS